MKINNIEEIKKLNIICTNAKETKECFNILKKIGLEVYIQNIHKDSLPIVRQRTSENIFISSELIKDGNKNISFYNFKQETKKFLIPAPQYNPKDVAFKSEIDEKAMIEYIKNNKVAIHCPSEEDFKKLNKIVKNEIHLARWSKWEEKTCYCDFCKTSSCVFPKLPEIFNDDRIILTVEELFDKFKIKKEEKPVEDIEYDKKTGRVLAINNYGSNSIIYYFNPKTFINYCDIRHLTKEFIDYLICMGTAYISQETRDKAEEKMLVENQLRNIANRLNNNVDIDWNNFNQEKYRLFFDVGSNKIIVSMNIREKIQGTTYCLSLDFKDVAIKEIGLERLTNYLKD